MPKELYLYSPIYSFVAESLISQIDENMGQEVTLRLRTEGGGPVSGWGLCAKMREHGDVAIKVDGLAASLGAFLLAYGKKGKVEALDVSRIMIHRADGPTETEEDQAMLNSMNADLRKALESRINVDKFKTVTGYTLDDVFDPTKRIDVWLTGAEAKKIGLVDKVVVLTPEEAKAHYDNINEVMATVATQTAVEQVNKKTMTIDELRAKHPDVFKAAMQEGVMAERDRVGAWLAFVEVDAKAVATGIEAGTNVSQKAMSEFALKSFSADALAKLSKDNAPALVPGADEAAATGKTEQELAKSKALSEFEAATKKSLDILK